MISPSGLACCTRVASVSDRNVTLVVCAAPLAVRTADIAAALVEAGWSPVVVATPDALPWLDVEAVRAATGEEIRTAHRRPGVGVRSSRPDAIVVCPATFNTLNKLAAGIADTYALGYLCEWMADDVPTIVVPMVNGRLWRHPAWGSSLATLATMRTTVLDLQTGAAGGQPVESGTGDLVVTNFAPQWLVEALAGID